MSKSQPDAIWTMGHSTRAIDEFIDVLKHYGIEHLVDVRRFPGSRRLPQFGQEALRRALADAGIGYTWIEALGGRRRSVEGTPNTAWRNASFRGYADHVASSLFSKGLDSLRAIADKQRTVIMCAEVLWWRCHRSLISDVLMAAGTKVWHIQDAKHVELHPYTQPARLYKGRVVYDSSKGEPLNERERQAPAQRNLEL